jgi:hypothetical protein
VSPWREDARAGSPLKPLSPERVLCQLTVIITVN